MEVWYYVVAGGIVALLRRPIILGFFALITWWLVRTNDDFTDYAIVWAAGYLVSVLHNRNALNFQVLLICCAVCAIFALLFAGLFAQPDIVAWKQNWIRHFNVAAGMAFASALAALVAGDVNLPKLLVSLFSGTAKFSYTLYLIHVPIFLLTFGVFERIIVGNICSSVMIAAIGTLVSIFVARGAARIFEDKKLLQRWMLDRNP